MRPRCLKTEVISVEVVVVVVSGTCECAKIEFPIIYETFFLIENMHAGACCVTQF